MKILASLCRYCLHRASLAQCKGLATEFFGFLYSDYSVKSCFDNRQVAGTFESQFLSITVESHLENHYFILGQAAVDRSYNVLMWEGPWDVDIRFYSLDVMVKTFSRAEIERTYRAAVDYLLVRPDVDAGPLPVEFMKKPGCLPQNSGILRMLVAGIHI